MKRTRKRTKLTLNRETLLRASGGIDHKIPPGDTGPIWSSPDYGYCGSFDGPCTYSCPEPGACW